MSALRLDLRGIDQTCSLHPGSPPCSQAGNVVIGVVFGSGLTLLLRYGVSFPAVLSLFWIITALVMCAMIGIVFGEYPAWKASRLDTVEALRYE
jgi:ABC-type antimicrobial peptide transport system permease subunit